MRDPFDDLVALEALKLPKFAIKSLKEEQARMPYRNIIFLATNQALRDLQWQGLSDEARLARLSPQETSSTPSPLHTAAPASAAPPPMSTLVFDPTAPTHLWSTPPAFVEKSPWMAPISFFFQMLFFPVNLLLYTSFPISCIFVNWLSNVVGDVIMMWLLFVFILSGWLIIPFFSIWFELVFAIALRIPDRFRTYKWMASCITIQGQQLFLDVHVLEFIPVYLITMIGRIFSCGILTIEPLYSFLDSRLCFVNELENARIKRSKRGFFSCMSQREFVFFREFEHLHWTGFHRYRWMGCQVAWFDYLITCGDPAQSMDWIRSHSKTAPRFRFGPKRLKFDASLIDLRDYEAAVLRLPRFRFDLVFGWMFTGWCKRNDVQNSLLLVRNAFTARSVADCMITVVDRTSMNDEMDSAADVKVQTNVLNTHNATSSTKELLVAQTPLPLSSSGQLVLKNPVPIALDANSRNSSVESVSSTSGLTAGPTTTGSFPSTAARVAMLKGAHAALSPSPLAQGGSAASKLPPRHPN
jgi:hypothetical protein